MTKPFPRNPQFSGWEAPRRLEGAAARTEAGPIAAALLPTRLKHAPHGSRAGAQDFTRPS